MIPLIEREIVGKKEWVEKEKIVDIFSVAGSLPGAIALNTSAFVGYYVAGIPGAICALLGNMTPSVIIVLTISILFLKFSTYTAVKAAFKGIYPVIVGMKDITCILIAIVAFGLSLFFDVEPIPIIIVGAIAGIVIVAIRSTKAYKSLKQPITKDGEGL